MGKQGTTGRKEERMEHRGRDRQNTSEKDTSGQKRKKEVTVLINFTLLSEFHPLHLNFGDRTLPIFTVL